jgi:PAS domain S-box-containing protein
MPSEPKTVRIAAEQWQKTQARLQELEETLRAIHQGEVDAVVISAPEGNRIYTLQGADHPFRVMVEAINEGAATLAGGGLVLYANGRFAEMLGIPLEKLIGSRLHDFVKTMNCPTLDELLERAETSPQKEECNLLVSGGNLLPAYLSLSPLKGSEFHGLCMIATDLTDQKKRKEELARTIDILQDEIRERKRAEEARRQTEEVFRSFMNHSPAVVFMKDEDGRYLFCNERVEEIIGMDAQELLGKTPLDWLPGESGRELHKRDLAVLAGRVPSENVESIVASNGVPVELLLVRFPFQDAAGRWVLGGVGVDVTAQRRAEAALRHLTGRILNVQDQERRRIARELHDSTAQTLSALVMYLAIIQSHKDLPLFSGLPGLLEKTLALAEQASKEIRNLSHLLHPPDLDHVGLIAAIRWHTQRIAEMTGVQITLDLPPEKQRLPRDIETAMFRILQESLENVRRHSQSPVAKVSLTYLDQKVTLEICDEGHGAAPGVLTNQDPSIVGVGIGVAGMRERMRQLGGRLSIDSNEHGTTVSAVVPIPSSEYCASEPEVPILYRGDGASSGQE